MSLHTNPNLLQLHYIFIISGKLNGVNHGTTFSAHDCFELGRQHYNSGDYENTIIWMKQAMKRLDEEVLGKETIKRSDLLEYIAFSHYTNGNLKKALQYTNELISVDPGHPRAHGNKLYYETNLDDDDSSDTDSRKKVRKSLVSRLIKVQFDS